MKLIVFDVDDTLTDSVYQHIAAYVDTMKEFGIEKINDNWKEYKHRTDSYILKKNYERNFTQTFNFSIVPEFERSMTKALSAYGKISEIRGAKNMTEVLAGNKDYAMAYATGSFLAPAYEKLNQMNLEYRPDLVVGSNEIFDREGIVKTAIEKAKIAYDVDDFEHIISIGDGIWDLKDWNEFDLNMVENKLQL